MLKKGKQRERNLRGKSEKIKGASGQQTYLGTQRLQLVNICHVKVVHATEIGFEFCHGALLEDGVRGGGEIEGHEENEQDREDQKTTGWRVRSHVHICVCQRDQGNV